MKPHWEWVLAIAVAALLIGWGLVFTIDLATGSSHLEVATNPNPDLQQQMRMAVAAERAVLLSIVQLILSGIGAAGLLATLYYMKKANETSARAAEASAASAASAAEATNLARRGYVVVDGVTTNRTIVRTPTGDIGVFNFGFGMANKGPIPVKVTKTITAIGSLVHGQPLSEVTWTVYRPVEGVHVIAPNTPMTGASYTVHTSNLEKVFRNELRFFLRVSWSYSDFFGNAEFFTETCMEIVVTGDPNQGEIIQDGPFAFLELQSCGELSSAS